MIGDDFLIYVVVSFFFGFAIKNSNTQISSHCKYFLDHYHNLINLLLITTLDWGNLWKELLLPFGRNVKAT